MTLASFMGAIAAGVAGAASGNLGLPFYPLAISALIFAGAAVLATLSARPIKVHYPAIDPNYLISNAFLKNSNAVSLAQELYVKMNMIEQNRKPIESALGLYREALYMACFAVVLATVGLIFSL